MAPNEYRQWPSPVSPTSPPNSQPQRVQRHSGQEGVEVAHRAEGRRRRQAPHQRQLSFGGGSKRGRGRGRGRGGEGGRSRQQWNPCQHCEARGKEEGTIRGANGRGFKARGWAWGRGDEQQRQATLWRSVGHWLGQAGGGRLGVREGGTRCPALGGGLGRGGKGSRGERVVGGPGAPFLPAHLH